MADAATPQRDLKDDPLRQLYQSLGGKGALPLDPDDPWYEPILAKEPGKDPIVKLWSRLVLAESESVHLLTGFRGNGKSTELRRLRKLLQSSGARVFLVDMQDFLLMTKPLEPSDFVLSLMTAFGQAVEQETEFKALTHSYWERLQRFLTAEVGFDGLDLDLKDAGAPVQLGLKLKLEPDFKQRIQERLRGHLKRLIADAHEYATGVVDALRQESGNPDLQVVLLVDSVEQLRGVGPDARRVHESVVELFAGQAPSLRFPKLHLVYTVPPYLQIMSHNIGRMLGGHPVVSWPNIHVRNRDGAADPAGIAVMERILKRRYGRWRRILPPEGLSRFAGCSGGDLRDFFRLVRESVIALMATRMGDPEAVLGPDLLKRVEDQLRNELLPLPEDDARWLARIHETKEPALPSTADLPELARFLDGNLIMNYLNGESWYDVHPLLIPEIERQTRRAADASEDPA